MKTVYIAAPYSSDPERNTQEAIEVMHELMDSGFAPFCPHLSHYAHSQRERLYEDWLELDDEFLAKCDVLLRLPGESPGADREVALAESLGIPVVYSVRDLCELRSQHSGVDPVKP